MADCRAAKRVIAAGLPALMILPFLGSWHGRAIPALRRTILPAAAEGSRKRSLAGSAAVEPAAVEPAAGEPANSAGVTAGPAAMPPAASGPAAIGGV